MPGRPPPAGSAETTRRAVTPPEAAWRYVPGGRHSGRTPGTRSVLAALIPQPACRFTRVRSKGRRSRSAGAGREGSTARFASLLDARRLSPSRLGWQLARACEQNGAVSPQDAAPSLRPTGQWVSGHVGRARHWPDDRPDGAARSRGFAPGSVAHPIQPSRSGRDVRAAARAGADRVKPNPRRRNGPRREYSSGSHAGLRDRRW